MAEALIGSWDYESVEGLEEYMEAAGLSEQMKEMARNTKPKVTISKDGDNWVIRTSMGDKELQTSYQVGTEVDTVSIMGKPSKATLTVTDNGLLETQKIEDLIITVERIPQDGNFIAKMTVKGVEARAKFVKTA